MGARVKGKQGSGMCRIDGQITDVVVLHELREFCWRAPTHHCISQKLKLRARKWFGEDVSPIDFGVNFLDLQPSSLMNLITKMMPFQRKMFGAWTIFVTVIGQCQSSRIVFKNDRASKFIDHFCVSLIKWHVEALAQFFKDAAHGNELATAHGQCNAFCFTGAQGNL